MNSWRDLNFPELPLLTISNNPVNQMKDIIIKNFPHMLHGGDYNPDQWQDMPEILSEDMRLMKLANCNEMTVGIFAWSALEPEEGKFDFTFLDKAMDDIYAAGGRVILATPSGARPVWMAQKYPEVLRTDENGIRNLFGRRHNHCFTSPVYREKVRIINTKLAQRYKNHPALIAWHLSNEYSGECHCETCKQAFRDWLKNKYGTLENLNKQWWTAFWAHMYTSWDQINPPAKRGDTIVHGHNLDWKRFVSAQTADFIRAEAEPIREITPDIPITTNLMGLFPGLDYRKIAEELDFASWDSYYPWHNDDSDVDLAAYAGLNHDLMRSVKKRPFLLMESTPSLVNWLPVNKLKRPGVNELLSLQAVAHGSDSVQYFQWRKSRGAFEKFHGAVVDHEGSENTRVFREVSALGARLKKLDGVVGTLVKSDVAIIFDWDNMWALQDAQFMSNTDKKYIPTLQSYYEPLWKRGINTDIIGEKDSFSDYKLIIAPMRYLVSEALGKKIEEFVKNGGIFYGTYTTAYVNENDLCYLKGFPGAGLRKVFGIWNEEIDTLFPEESNTVVSADKKEYKAIDCCELIHSEGASVLATYASEFYAGMPAFTCNSYGKGKAYYQAFRDDGTFADETVGNLLKECGIKSDFDGVIPFDVTAHSRTDGETVYVFIENHSVSEKKISFNSEWTNTENGEKMSGEITLGAHRSVIVEKTEK